MQVRWGRALDVQDRLDRRGLEPRKLTEGQEVLLVVDQDPEPVLRDVGDLNGRR